MDGLNLDFSKLNVGSTSDTASAPRDIFTALPSKKTKFQYPRDVQSQVWEEWYSRRNNQTNIIKMNTGSGKTSVGLIILKSCMNDGFGPAVYIVPDNYLVEQVLEEARDLGIPTTQDEKSHKFQAGKEILVTNMHKLVNGRSVFGVGDEGIKISIGSVIIDDAHACLSTIEEQFTLSISRSNPAYNDLFRMFENSMITQGSAKTLEISNGDPNSYVRVPFWQWQDKIDDTLAILLKNKENQDLSFKWSLVKEHLKQSQCIVSAHKIEISPHCIPIQMIPSLFNAKRKILMTATLVDESILSSHFGITDDSIFNPITPKTIGDIGDRMILMPQVINPNLTDIEVKKMCHEISQHHNVVVIVPSKSRAVFWEDVASKILSTTTIQAGVQELRRQHVGLVVLINRYDGVDLPNTACRLLIIDGLPDVRRLVDKVTQGVLLGSEKINDGIIQRIEQGMGRGVRSSDDYCAVLLLGKSLTGAVFLGSSLDKFSPATKAQIKISQGIVDLLPNNEASSIRGALEYCLQQSQSWVSASKSVLTGLGNPPKNSVNSDITNKRTAYDLASRNMLSEAATLLRNNAISDDKIYRGYLKEFAAEYINMYDAADAQVMLKSASNDNHRVLKPLTGVQYLRLEGETFEQAKECSSYLRTAFRNPNEIIVYANSILENLIFMPDTSNLFEDAIDKLAKLIGFKSNRPENDTGKGPDNIWCLGSNKYFVIECKNGVTTERINKHDAYQLNGSATAWFNNVYDHTSLASPILIHPDFRLEYAASLNAGTRVITKPDLERLKASTLSFISALCTSNKTHDEEFIRMQLISCKLRASDMITNYTRDFK